MRGSVVAALAVATLGAGAAPALVRRTQLLSTTRRAGAVVTHLPRTITPTFGAAIPRVSSIRGDAGRRGRAVGTPVRAPRNARRALARVRGDLQGRDTVTWAVVGADGHATTGSRRFRVRRPPD